MIVDSVTVAWPSGEHSTVNNVGTNQYLSIREPGPFLSLPPAIFDVGQVQFGMSGQAIFYIKNAEDDPFNITSLAITGSVFSLSPETPPSQTVAGGDSLAVSITFTPDSRSIVSDTLLFSHTAHGNDVSVIVTGTGYDTIPPATAPTISSAKPREGEVRLQWTTIVEADLSHYVVYRSTITGSEPDSGDSVSQVNRPDTTFLDRGLNVGTAYFYRISGVDSSGNEGPASVEASAIPHEAVVFNEIGGAAGLIEDNETIGLALGDYNGDGLLDFAATNRSDGIWLYTNNGNNTFTFSELSTIESNHGIAWGDYDNDGDLDLFAAHFQFGAADQLYRNNGNGTFTNVASQAGVNSSTGSQGAAWGDYDNDGDLDLFVAMRGSNALGSPNKLFNNDGTGIFTEVDVGFGAYNDRSQTGTWGDFDNDGDLDLYVANSSGNPGDVENKLYRNDGNDTFTDISGAAGVDSPGNDSTAPIWVDYDNDDDLDLWVSNNDDGEIGNLYRNDGSQSFTDVAATAGLSIRSIAAAWMDYNADGYQDLYVTRNAAHPSQANSLYRNNGDGTFSDAALSAGVAGDGDSRAAAWGDMDRDGDPDLIVVNYTGQSTMLYDGMCQQKWDTFFENLV